MVAEFSPGHRVQSDWEPFPDEIRKDDGVPEYYTASLVGHHTARSANKLTYVLYSAGISDVQKRGIIDGIRLPEVEGLS